MREVLIAFLLALVVGSAINGYTSSNSQPSSTSQEATSPESTTGQVQATPSAIVYTSQATFAADVLNNSQPVLVDFYASWCGPCKMMKPTIEQIASQYQGKIKVAQVDVDANPELAKKFQVEALPTFMLFSQGKPVARHVGFTTKEKLLASIDQYAQ